MRTFKKILACILAVLLTVTILPLSVFAAPPAEEGSGASATPGYALEGNKPDGTVTVTLSLDKLRELLEDPTDVAKLLDELKGFVEIKGNVITLAELMELVPLDNVMEIILGEGYSKLPDLIEKLGGMEVVLKMINVNELIAGISKENMTALMTYVSSLDGFESVLQHVDELLSLGITIKDLAYVVETYMDQNKLKARGSNLTNDNINSVFQTGKTIEDIIDMAAFRTAVLTGLSNGTIKKNNGDALTFSDIIDLNNVDFSEFKGTIQSILENDPEMKAKILNDMIDQEVIKLGTITEFDGITVRINDILKNETAIIAKVTAALAEMVKVEEPDVMAPRVLDILKTAGVNCILKEKLPADAITQILGNASYYNEETVKAWIYGDEDLQSDIKALVSVEQLKGNGAIVAAAQAILTANPSRLTDEILTDAGKAALIAAKIADPSRDETDWFFKDADESCYNSDKVVALLWEAADDAGVVLTDLDNFDTLKTNATIQAKLQTKLSAMTAEEIRTLVTGAGIQMLFEGMTFTADDVGILINLDNKDDYYYDSAKLENLVKSAVEGTDVDLKLYYQIDDYGKLLANDPIKDFLHDNLFAYVTSAQIAGAIDGAKLWSYFKPGFDPFAVNDLVDIALDYLNWTNVTNTSIVKIQTLLDILLGSDSITVLLKDKYSLMDLIQDEKVIDLAEVFEKIQSSPQGLTYFVNLNKLINLIPASYYPTLFGYFNRTTLINQLLPHWRTFFNAISNKDKTDIAQLLVTSVIDKVDLVKLQGDVIAEENAYGALSVDIEQLVKTVLQLIPTPDDLANITEDGVLIAFNLQVKYQTQEGETKNKNVDFRLVLENGLETISKLAEKAAVIKRYINIKVDGTNVAVELNVPVILEKLYARAAQLDGTPAQVALKEKLLSAEGMTGDELLTLLAETPLSEIIDALEDVDLNAIYQRAVNFRYTEKVVEKFNSLVGTDFDVSSLGSLDDLMDAAIDGKKLPSIEKIVKKLSDKVGKDLEGILEKVAKTADQNKYVQKLIDRVAQIDRLAPYVEGISAEKILDTYKGYDPIHAVNEFIKDEIGRDVLAKIDSYDSVQSLYEAALNKVETKFKGTYNRVIALLRNLTKEDYESDNRFVALLQAYLPTRAIKAFLNNSINRLYRGNGVFATGDHSVTIPVEKIIDRAIKAVQSRVPQIDSSITNMIRGLISVDSVKVGGSLTVNFQNLRKVIFLNEDGTRLMTTYLPIGVNPMKAVTPKAIEGKKALGWADENGLLVTKITGDQTLTALYAEEGEPATTYTVTYWFFNGTELEEAAQQIFTDLKAGDAVPALTAIPAVPATFPPLDKTMVYYMGKGTTGAKVADPTEYTVGNKNIDFTVAYIPDGFISGTNSFTFEFVKDTDGKHIFEVTMNGDEIALQILMSKLPGTDVLKKLILKNADGSIVITLGENMLSLLKAKYPTSTIEFKASLKATVGEYKFENGGKKLYTTNSGLRYDFDLLVDGVHYNKDTFGDFPDDMEISLILPAGNAVLNASNQKTFAHFVDNGTVTDAIEMKTVDATANQITFHVDHFSEYAIVNEYLLKSTFPSASGKVTINGYDLPDEGIFVPAGATVWNLGATVDSNLGKRITTVKVNDITGGELIASVTRKTNFTMPAQAAILTVNTANIEYKTFWVVDGTHIFDTKAEAEACLAAGTVKAPAGYEYRKDATSAYVWDNDQVPATVQKDVYRTLVLDEKTYTVTFVPGEGKANDVKSFKISEIPTFVAPIGADVTGKVFKEWDLGGQTLAAILDDIVKGTKADGYSINAKYDKIEYKLVYADGTEQMVAYATDVTPTAHFTLAANEEIDEIFYVTGTGTSTKVAYGATFPMPAETVHIEITTKVKVLSISLRNEADGSSQMVNLADGTNLLVPVTVPAGQALTAAPANGTLISIIDNGDGVRTFVFEIAKSTLGTDNTITYRTAAQSAGETELAVGDKNATPKGVAYEGAVASDQTVYVTASYAFATYKSTQTRHSLLWLWILLIVLAVCAIIGLIYWLYIHGKIKGCFVTVAVVFIVTIFLKVCLAWANLILAIERLFTGRRKEDDFKAHGMEDPATEETTEEKTEEKTEEATEEATKEEAPADEKPAEDKTEKTSEEEK